MSNLHSGRIVIDDPVAYAAQALDAFDQFTEVAKKPKNKSS